MKKLAFGIIISTSLTVCCGQAKSDSIDRQNIEPISKGLDKFNFYQQLNTKSNHRYDSASFAHLLRSKFISLLKSTSPGDFRNSSSIMFVKHSDNYNVIQMVYQRPVVIHTLINSPARDMPRSSNLIPRGRRPDTPYYLRANRYDWMIYRGN